MDLHKNNVVAIAPVLIMVVAVVVPSFGCSSSSGLQYSVGDSLWTIPPFPEYFSNWSSSHFFKIGDSLVFDFETGRYDVIQVSSQDYESCNSLNPSKIFYGGPTIIQLHERGVFYFICNFSNYCDLGQKIAITVHDCREVYPPSPSPSPSPASTITPPSLPPYKDGSEEPPVPVPSLAPSNVRDSSENHPPAKKSTAARLSRAKGEEYPVGEPIHFKEKNK
ncbi:cucumber peeling cupredoxin [Morus notabilis]|uniref:cucumber peeling cupredoxin n=1 Tax=Morus notabilis TaxID=981085 RepID=UPI000CED4253|nr:cucumber peeling cupredoxin [Morus notabilis]